MIVYIAGVPTHPFATGVIVIVEVIGDAVEFVVANEGMSPEPLAASPMVGLLFIQVNVVPFTGPDNVVTAATVPAQ